VQSLEPAFYGSCSECGPGSHRTGDPFEVYRAEVLELEQVAHEPPCALSDDNAVRLSNALQARRKVRRLANDCLLLRSAGADQVADDHQTRCDADARLKGSIRLQVANGLH
jgi:hypothetical protein